CDHVNALHVDGEDLLVATSCGLGRLDAESGAVQDWWTTRDGLPHRIVYAVTVHDGFVVAGTNDGLALRPRRLPIGPRVASDWRVVRARPGSLGDNWITAVASASD